MATPNVGILTTAGKALIAKVNSGQAKISFSKVVFSSMDNSQLSDTQVKALTAISPQEVVVSPPETTLDTASGETRIRATGTNKQLADGVYVKTYGVFAKDDTGNEILYGVTVSPNPNYFPAYDGVTPQAVTYSYKTVIQETSNITMTNSNDVYVTQEDLTEAIGKIPQPDLSSYATQQQLATKADDSKVVHSTVTQLNSTDMNTVLTAGFYRLASGTNMMPNTDEWALYQVINLNNTNGVQLAYGTNKNISGIRSWHTSYDTGKSAITFSSWVRVADDSKVAHLSGANNFDTVPTVNNNPLLLASSLPSDLARTSQQTNFTDGLQKGGKDVATVDDVSAKQDKLDYTPANAANVVDRNPDTGVVSEPVDFTKLTVNGGKSVATSDDLKSLETSAWRPLTLENANNGAILFKDNGDGTASLTGSANFVIAADSGVITEAIYPPSGYQFSSLAWNKGVNGNGIYAIGGRSGTSGGSIYTPSAFIDNGKICFKGGSYSYPELMFSPCLNTTDKTSSSCEPAIVGITKV